jgi:hypothetical protein
VNISHEGLSLWYGTPDAPAPFDLEVVPRKGVSVVVGVRPASPSNAVLVRYRVDGGIVRAVPGRELRTDYNRDAQYFAATFPAFPTGDVVEYSPMLSSAGRQVPPPHVANRLPSKFRLAAKEVCPPVQTLRAPTPDVRRFGAGLDFVGAVVVQFEPLQFIGETAAGMRVNFFVREGTVEGRGFRAKVTAGSSDQMIIRRDGIGVVRIRAAFATEDGAILDVESGGHVDFGPDGYRRAVAHQLPDRAPLVVSPLVSTRHPKYAWLSRVQCVGAGQTHLDVGQASYDVYAVSPKAAPTPQPW